MSSLAPAPERAASEPAGTTPVRRVRRPSVSLDLALGALLAGACCVVVFVASGGSNLGPNTWVEIALLVVAAAAAVALALAGSRVGVTGRSWGAATVVLFIALAGLTYFSIAWSVQPATSWMEANRTLSYLAAFAAAVALARLLPARWPAVVGAIGTVAVVVCGYALLTKVFPATLNSGDHLGRLRVPFDYWNATGLMAALGLPVCLWAGARPGGGRALRALAVPALTILLTVLVLSYSRGALVAAVVGLACWLVLVPLRLRATLILALGAVGGAVAAAWALAHHAITHDNASLAARTAAGHDLGLVLLVVLAVTTVAGLIVAQAMDRVTLTAATRRRIGTALVVLVAMVPFVAIAGAAASSRGLTGQISHVWSTLTSTGSAQPGNNAARLASLGNSRPLYWSEGLKVGEHSLLAGAGAGGFDTAHTRWTTNPLPVRHAHSYLIETFADFGLIGIAVSFALLAAWALACRCTLLTPPGDARGTPERTGMFTLLAVAVTFGVSSAIDWTWFVPGVTVPALLAAGWLAGRGPLTAPAPARTPTSDGRTHSRRLAAATPGQTGGALAIVAVVLVAGWFVWQPLRSSDAMGAAISAVSRGDSAAAFADARSAAASDPVSFEPLWELSALYSATGNQAAARQELVKATQVQPSNPQTWQQLGSFDLQAHHPQLALPELRTAQRLDPTSAVPRS